MRELCKITSPNWKSPKRTNRAEADLARVRTETGLFINSDASEGTGVKQSAPPPPHWSTSSWRYLTDLEAVRLLETQVSQASSATSLPACRGELLAGPALTARGVLTPRTGVELPGSARSAYGRFCRLKTALAGTAVPLTSESDGLQVDLAAEWQSYAAAARVEPGPRDI